MKTKSLLLFLALMIITAAAWSQTTYGVRAGLNISNQKLSYNGESESSDSKVGISFGGYAQFALNDKITLQPELNFSQMGVKEDGYTSTLNYLAIPVTARYQMDKFSLFAGPQFSFLLSAKDKVEGESITTTDAYKGFELSGLLGAGYQISDKIAINAQYQLGLSNVAEDSGDAKLKNNAFSFGLAYKLK